MAKIYYTDAEAASKLGISLAELSNYVRDGKLRSYQDGMKKMFKVEEVEKLAGPAEVELAPADGPISLAEADKPRGAGKEDTVITAEGISIFDDEDLEIEAADPMAKTQIAPTLDEQVSIEGVGSGSGLLDLTRESDDTSLGEVLEHIDEPAAAEVSSSLEQSEEHVATASGASEVVMMAPNFVEMADPSSGAFGGMVAALALVLLGASAVGASILTNSGPSLADTVQANMPAAVGGAAAVVVVGAVIGLLAGKASAKRVGALR